MVFETASLDKHGRLVIPANFRKEMGWKPGERLTLAIADNELRVLSRRQAIEQLRAEVQKNLRPGVSLVDELIRERREEVRREEEEYQQSKAEQERRAVHKAGKSRG